MANPFIKKVLLSQFSSYLIRVIIGFLVGYVIFLQYPNYDLFWMLLTILLVISPEEKDARKLSIERFKANFIGSLSSLAVLFIPIQDVYKIILGIVVAAAICKIVRLMNVARSAIVAIIIILLEHKDDSYWAPLGRFAAVASGCLIGLAVTLTYFFMLRKATSVAERVQHSIRGRGHEE